MRSSRTKWLTRALIGLVVPASQAATYYVHPSLGSDSNTGLSWTVPFQTLQRALTQAALVGGSNQIWVTQGTYIPSATFGGTSARHKVFLVPFQTQVYGGFEGPGTNFPNGEMFLTDRNPEVNLTILDGDLDASGNPNPDGNPANNCYHVVYFHVADTQTKLSGFIIQNGNADHPTVDRDARGGGIGMHTDDGAPVLNRLIIRNNRARLGGGGMHCAGKAITYATNCLFRDNIATEGIGGGVLAFEGGANFQNCVFHDNTAPHATDGKGGAFATAPVTPPARDVPSEVVNCTFHGNEAAVTGGAMFGGFIKTHVRVANAIFWNNADGASVPFAP